jgi:ribosome-associated translation inhibitor RaiA
MAGNTRGKLKEHFEGIHKNFDWVLRHVEISLALIAENIKASKAEAGIALDDEQLRVEVEKHYLYNGIKALAEGVQTMDDCAKAVYDAL